MMKAFQRIALVLLLTIGLSTTFSFTTLEGRSIGTPQFGICHLATVPLRASYSHKSETVTQMLFGEAYSVTEKTNDGEWLKIRMSDDYYQGWIPSSQFKEVTKGYFRKYKETYHPIVSATFTQLLSEQGALLVSIGSVMPFYKDGQIDMGGEKLTLTDVNAISMLPSGKIDMIDVAKKYVHVPYLWGGKSIFGIDCSGFVQQVAKTAKNVYLPRDAYQQATRGEQVPWNEARAGDLAFFQNAKGRIIHVGIIMANHQIIHASGKVRIDKFTPEGIYVEEQKKHSHQLAFVRRLN